MHHRAFVETAQRCEFPYTYRPGQRGLVVSAYKALKEGKPLFIQASTGIGKTLSTIFPAVRVLGEEQAERIFYLTAKTITRSVAKEAMEILRRNGLYASYLLITAKEKMCFLEEMDCNPEVCPYAKGHMDRVNDAVYELITTKNGIDREDILEMAEKHQVCPFELSLDVAYYVDVIICDYNYVFDPNVRLQRFFGNGDETGSVFLVDEAHNLIDRAREMVSVTVVKEQFVKVRKIIREISRHTATRVDACNKALLALKRSGDEFRAYTDVSEINDLVVQMDRLYDEFARFSERYPGFYDKDFSELYFTVRDFCGCMERLEEGYVIYSRIDEEGQFVLKLFCTDPSAHLKRCMLMGRGTVFFSATMLPIAYYKRLLGGAPEDYAIYAQSPFDPKRRLLLLGGDVSTKYTRRTDEEYHRVGEYIRSVTGKRPGNYMVFFPSYAYMSRMVDELYELEDVLQVQDSRMNEAQREAFLAGFRDNADGKHTRIGMCVMGGIFSEGIDLKGDSLIGVIVVGTGLPQISRERDLLRQYFDEHGLDGFSYAYLYPGMNKVLQSAGRLIRTDEDCGVIVLLDERFMRWDYRQLFPREWADIRQTSLLNVGEDVQGFWEETACLF
jgi:Rad3-related DNA helicase